MFLDQNIIDTQRNIEELCYIMATVFKYVEIFLKMELLFSTNVIVN